MRIYNLSTLETFYPLSFRSHQRYWVPDSARRLSFTFNSLIRYHLEFLAH